MRRIACLVACALALTVRADAMRKNGATDLYLFNLFLHPQDGEVWNGMLSEGLDEKGM